MEVNSLNEALQTEINVMIPTVFLIVGLIFIILIDPYYRREQRRSMLMILAAVTALILHEGIHFYAEWNGAGAFVLTICAIFAYSIRPAIIVLTCHLIDSKRKLWMEWVMVAVNAVIHLTSLFSGVCFQITEDSGFIRGPLGYTSHIVSAVLIARLVYVSLRIYGQTRKAENMIPIFAVLMIIMATAIDSFGGELRFLQVPLLLPAIVGGCIFFYIWLHLQYVREHENDMLAQQRIRIMVSQMRPHFIYNSLNVIGAYLDEPEKAEEALENFTGFLRGSIDLLDSTECIPAEQEFKTVEHFLYLEKERFGDKLEIKLEISDVAYEMPAFTVQTLVENAISHGIRRNKGGRGTLIVKSFETEKTHVIEVQDDGVGFVVSDEIGKLKEAGKEGGENIQNDLEEHSHIGLRNLSERLRYMCNGTMKIQSKPGQGTKAQVRIPKKESGKDE